MHRILVATNSSWLLAALLSMSLILSACGTSDGNSQGSQSTRPVETATTAPQPATATEPEASPTEPDVQADATRVEPDVSPEDRQALVEGLNRFAVELYRAAAAESDENLIFSPASISLAFSMVYAGARGDTEAQMADVLGFLPQEEQHPAANALDQHLTALGTEPPPPGMEQGEPFQLNIANGIWGQQDFPFLDTLMETLFAHYGAELRQADFINAAEAARQEINDWVSERTEGRIPEAVPEGVLDEMTRLVLANAIYFNAAWLRPFDEAATADGSFTLLDGSQVTVPMMRQSGASIPYAEGDGYQAVVMPYTGSEVEMVLVLPAEGNFEQIEADMTEDFFEDARSSADTRSVTLTMPKFDFESRLALHEILPEMSMPAAFDADTADFSGIADPSDLYIGVALHQANITVDEKGTEAAAVTIIGVEATGAPESAEITLDRPFLFAIVERETGAVLFMGRVVNPSS